MKKFSLILLTLLITILISLLCISYGVKDACINTLSNAIVKDEITSKIINEVSQEYPEVDYDILKNIEESVGNSEKINELTTKFFDNIVMSISNNKDVEVPNTKQELLALINENEAILEESGIEISDAKKEKIVNQIISDNSLEKVYYNVTKVAKGNLTTYQKNIVNSYNLILSTNFRATLIILIMAFTIIIALIKKSSYRWSYNLSVSSVLAGATVSFIIPLLVSHFGNELTDKLIGKSVDININTFINYGYICLIVSALLIVMYIGGNKITNYKSSKYCD